MVSAPQTALARRQPMGLSPAIATPAAKRYWPKGGCSGNGACVPDRIERIASMYVPSSKIGIGGRLRNAVKSASAERPSKTQVITTFRDDVFRRGKSGLSP